MLPNTSQMSGSRVHDQMVNSVYMEMRLALAVRCRSFLAERCVNASPHAQAYWSVPTINAKTRMQQTASVGTCDEVGSGTCGTPSFFKVLSHSPKGLSHSDVYSGCAVVVRADFKRVLDVVTVSLAFRFNQKCCRTQSSTFHLANVCSRFAALRSFDFGACFRPSFWTPSRRSSVASCVALLLELYIPHLK